MRRMYLAIGLVGLFVIGVTLPAQGKVAGRAIITGPGLEEPMIIDGGEGTAYPGHTGLFDQGLVQEAPAGNLGPRYVARVMLEIGEPQPPIEQHLYPFAESGPLVYTPPGQRLLDRQAPTGWFIAGQELIRLLRSRGLPSSPPPSTGQDAPAARSSVPGPALPWALGALSAALVLGAALARRRAAAGVA